MNNVNLLLQLMSNPQQVATNLMKNNPQFNALINQQKRSGLNMEQFVRQYAKQNNIDIEPMLNLLSQRGIKF